MNQMLPDRVREVEELMILMHEPTSLDALVRIGEDRKPLADLIPGDDGQTAINNIYRKSLIHALSFYLAQLPEIQRNVVKWIHIDERLRNEIAESLSTTPSKIRQIESMALRNIRLKMRFDPRFAEYSTRRYNYSR